MVDIIWFVEVSVANKVLVIIDSSLYYMTLCCGNES